MAEVKFRDGPRDVVPHLAELMADIETHKLTYDDAVKQANAKLQTDYLNRTLGAMVTQHFRDQRGS